MVKHYSGTNFDMLIPVIKILGPISLLIILSSLKNIHISLLQKSV